VDGPLGGLYLSFGARLSAWAATWVLYPIKSALFYLSDPILSAEAV